MAAFTDGRAALAAALAIQRQIRALDTAGIVDTRQLVKIGVHSGPCFVVTLNERLDYFGMAVNLAARAQHEARGGEIVATEAVFAEAREEIAAAGLAGERVDVVLKGLREAVHLYRFDCQHLWPDTGAGEASPVVERSIPT
jgi:class 3 adenylate cyclase